MTTRSIDASTRIGGVSENRSETAASPHLEAQQLLNQFYSRPRLPEHGRGDAETRQALLDFQHTRGLEPTGLPDRATLDELGRAIAWQAHEDAAASATEPFDPIGPSQLGAPTPLGIPVHFSDPFQNHDLWVSELEHGPQGVRRPRRHAEVPAASSEPQPTPESSASGPELSERVRRAAAEVTIGRVPVVPNDDLQQGVGTVAGIGVSAVNVALSSAALVGGEITLLVSGTIRSLKNAGDVREARGEMRGLLMASHLFDARGRISDDGRIHRQTMERFLRARYGQELRADTVTGAGADGPRRVAEGRQRGIDRILRQANQVLATVDARVQSLSVEDRARVDLDALREDALALFQQRTLERVAPHALREDVAVD